MTMYTAQDLLSEPVTSGYIPEVRISGFYTNRNRPHFSGLVVREMLADPRVIFGLWLLKGPLLANAKFFVKCENPEVKEFLKTSITRFWRNSASRALKAIEWGYSGSEVIYRVDENGSVAFDILKDLDSMDVKVATDKGRFSGMVIRNVPTNKGKRRVYIGGPKAFLHTHWRERNTWYGLSRLFGAHIPWWEQWSDGGFRDIRRLWFYKNAFEGGTIYHPPGITRLKDGSVVSNKDLARELIEKKRTGGTLTMPNNTTGDGQTRAWEYDPPQSNNVPNGLLEYGPELRDEILEGMGIPPEVIEASGGEGFGSSSGRAVPQMAFFSTLQEVLQWLVTDADTQIFRPTVALNFGEVPYEICPFNLWKSMLMDTNSEDASSFGDDEQDQGFVPGKSFKPQKGIGAPPSTQAA